MSEIHWLTLNKRLQQGVLLINNLTNKKYELLLAHISESTTEDFFTESELSKLQESLKLSKSELQLLIQSIAYIHKQSTKVLLKPTDLQHQLVEIVKLNGDKAEIFTKKWSVEAQKDLGDFEGRVKLDKMSWELGMQIASDMGSGQAVPNAKIQLELSKISNNKEKENVVLELGEAELHQLYNTLEVIQLKLDNVAKN